MIPTRSFSSKYQAEWSGEWNLLPPLVAFPMTFQYARCRDDERFQLLTFIEESGRRKTTFRIPLNVCMVVNEHEAE